MYFINCITLLMVLSASGINADQNEFRYGDKRYPWKFYTKQLANYNNGSPIDVSLVVMKWIKQPVDHFNEDDHRMWKMRYFENLEFWKPNSTIYVSIGGQTVTYPVDLRAGTIYDLANETNGAMFETEHRYYGDSMPLDTTILENLKYLSSRQALADLAYLIKSIKSSPKFKDSTSSKVVVTGGGYAGNLAAWMRLLYPDLVDAAIASSAPVLAKKDFYEFFETVSDDYLNYGPKGCYEKIREIFGRYDLLIKTPEGIKQLKAEEQICEHIDMTKPENQQLFFYFKAEEFAGSATYGNINDIKEHCSRIMNSSFITTKFAFKDDPLCYYFDLRDEIDYILDFPDHTSKHYQFCTEFGYLKTSNSDKQIFTHHIPAEIFYKICAGVFGEEYNEKKIDEGVKHTNDLYGGLTPNVTRVIFVNGDMDPWSKLGVLKDLNDDAPAIVIPRTSHCKFLQPKRQDDSDELVKARIHVKNLIKTWLNIHEYNSQ